MKINENVIKGKWLEIRGDLQKAWGKLTNDELDKTKGDLKSIRGLLQQKYGKTQDHYSAKVDQIFAKFEKQKDAVVSEVKNFTKN